MNPKSNFYVPVVLEQTARGERSADLWSRLLSDRIVYLGTEVDDHVANLIVGQLLYLQSQDPDEEISFYINSPGGLVTAGLAIYDTMQNISNPISTVCLGQACSMGAVLLAAGSPGKRKALPNARIMIHQLSGGAYGKGTDVEIQVKEMLRLKLELNKIMAHHTGKTIEQVTADMERDYWMSSVEAKVYGLVDTVMPSKK